MPDQPFDIAVVASHRRPPIITEHLAKLGLAHFVVYSPDYEEPGTADSPEPAPERSQIAKALWRPPGPGAYRCFKAHQMALGCGRRDKILVLEDDARHSDDIAWNAWSQAAVECLDQSKPRADVVSLHARDTRCGVKLQWWSGSGKFDFWELNKVVHNGVKMRHQAGALAYMVRRETAESLAALQWVDLPWDFVIANTPKMSFVFADPSPFIHDRRHGSLVEAPR